MLQYENIPPCILENHILFSVSHSGLYSNIYEMNTEA